MCIAFPFLWHDWLYNTEEYIKDENVTSGEVSVRSVRICSRPCCHKVQIYKEDTFDSTLGKWVERECDSHFYPSTMFINLIYDLIKNLDIVFASHLKKEKLYEEDKLIYEIVGEKVFVVFTPNTKNYVCTVVLDELGVKYRTYYRWRVFNNEKLLYATFYPDKLVERVKILFLKKVIEVV